MLKLNQTASNPKSIHSKALYFGLVSAFLCAMGFTVIAPVVPFLVSPYTHGVKEQAIAVTSLTSVYGLCVFLAAPVLGALSDRFGRRPLLLISLLGTSLGFFIFALGGSLEMLFIGRMIEGITAGSISTIFAYFADITPREERSKYFGWVSAVAGAGVIIGPSFGGLLAHFGYAVPMYVGAIIALMNALYGWRYMPESLSPDKRIGHIERSRINPLSQLRNVFSTRKISILLGAAFFLWLPSGALQAIMAQFTRDVFQWTPTLIGLVFSIMGFQDIFAQGLIMPRLLQRFSDKTIALLGMGFEMLGYGCVALSAIFRLPLLFIVGMFVYGFGDAIFGPSFNGMLSKAAKDHEQGRIQGGSQSVQAIARVLGPILGGQLYIVIGQFAPALMGVALVAIAIIVMNHIKKEAV